MKNKVMFALQIASLMGIWIFVLGISTWIIQLIRVANRLQDAANASVGISLVAIPVFFTGAAVLTYVFIGLQRGRE
jgi:formate hydrogenlyase subunit 3/multisubunit Na+/H+ antiporter MnhD subunit